MFNHLRKNVGWIALLAVIAALAAPTLAIAGGWAVVTLDRLPGPLVAGKPYTLGMMVRQHGRTPWQVEGLRVEARQVDTGKTLTFTARPDGQPGHYQVELLLHEPGRWEWGIGSGLYPSLQPMPALEVTASDQPAGKAANTSAGADNGVTGGPAPLLGFLALMALAGGAALLVRSQKKRFPSLAGAGLLFLCGGVAFAFFLSANAEAKRVTLVPVIAGAETTGQKLFLAKGCVVCHTNDRAIEGSEEFGVNLGPNLTTYRNDPGYLHKLLKDPRSVRTDPKMPDLELKPDEIEVLISFLNGQEQQ